MAKLKIVIADDIFTNRLLLSEIIKDLGHECIVAKNGKEAVSLVENNNINLVLMDIEMPVMNGLEATFYIRNSLAHPNCDTPVVALSAHNPKFFFSDFKDAGFDRLLAKPYSMKKVMELIESFA